MRGIEREGEGGEGGSGEGDKGREEEREGGRGREERMALPRSAANSLFQTLTPHTQCKCSRLTRSQGKPGPERVCCIRPVYTPSKA